MDPDTQEHTK